MDSVKIFLPNRKSYAIVDAEDYFVLNQFKWLENSYANLNGV